MVDTQAFFDIIVVGGGPVGLAAAASAAARGRSVAVLESHDFHGGHGSSGDAERQWRLQYAEADLSALTLAARTAWAELAAAGRRRLVHETGSLWFGDTSETSSEGQIDAAVGVLDELNIEYEEIDAEKLRSRFGFHDLPANYTGIYQPDGGVIDVAAARWALLEQAEVFGCALHTWEPVVGLTLNGTGATVRTSVREYRCDQVIVTTGAWAAPLLAQVGVRLDVTLFELTQAHFRVKSTVDYPTWFAFQSSAESDSNLFYGFGRVPWAADDLVQVAPLFEQDPVRDPALCTGIPRPHDIRRVSQWVREHMPDLEPEPLRPTTCLAALPSAHDRQFYLGSAAGLVPNGERLVVSTAGWGFKFIPVFGTACADLALTGRTEYGLERFGLAHPVDSGELSA